MTSILQAFAILGFTLLLVMFPAMVIASGWACHRFWEHLRNRHPDVWRRLGRPHRLPASRRTALKSLEFLLKSEFEKLDMRTSTAARQLRWMLVADAVALPVLVYSVFAIGITG